MEITIPAGQGQEGDSFELSSEEPTTSSVPFLEASERDSLPPPPAQAQASSGGSWREEDRTFPGSDIAITIVLFREDGHPDGRLVQIVVKDFGDVCASKTYRARQLTRDSELDGLQQQGLNEVVQQFWFLLEERRKKAVQEKARQKSAPAQVSPATASASPPPHTPASIPPATQPVPKAKPASPQTQFEFF